MKKFILALVSVLVVLTSFVGLTGCSQKTAVNLSVAAAASLTDALNEINALYTNENKNVTIAPNYASSGTLQKQIEQGAPVDVFISAGASQMDALEKAALISSETRKNILNNKVVLVVPTDSTLGITSFNDLTKDTIKQIAIGDPKSVPAGNYGQQAFDKLGIAEQIKAKLVLASDVRQVLSYVESGNVDTGIVYATDAKISDKVKVVASAPDEINAKIVYPAAVVKATKNAKTAQDYLDFLSSNTASDIFKKYGFGVVQ
jgi:molybdate transport system substrate-binding protein